MGIEFQQCSHLCIRCRRGQVPYSLSSSGPWVLADGLKPATCPACGAKHSVQLRDVVEGERCTVAVTLLAD